MVRIAGVDIPNNKKIWVSLTYIYGIGPFLSKDILSKAQIDENKQSNLLTEDEVAKIRDIIDSNHKVEGDLRQVHFLNIKRLMDLGCYKGIRHRKSLPVHGQRTHSNAQTRRKKRKILLR
ncbi:MAG: 30S ribosomal protein S13 [Deltaproteobacteria bacterium]|nr:MAG: 30S ribosomal protein S13 [Deltaproteobacteria bacterium]